MIIKMLMYNVLMIAGEVLALSGHVPERQCEGGGV